jgi:hypothetical protein
MITFFTTAKPFCDHNATIQRNALRSWQLLHPDVEVILFGNEEGAAEAARELGIRHVPQVRTVESGPKLLPSFFDVAQRVARHDLICYVNCDIVLSTDFLYALNAVDAIHGAFLMVGRRWNVEVDKPITFRASEWEEELVHRALAAGQQSSGDWIDFFAFRKGFYLGKMPEMVIGRVYWDQWLVWKAQNMGAVVVDASEVVMAIHQNHDYGYHPAGKAGVWTDALAQRNYALAGGRWHLRTIDDATHVLGPEGLRENPERRKRAAARVLRTAKDAAWVTAMDWTRPLRRAMGLRKRPPSENGVK